MSITETEAKRLCRLSGAYCDLVDASERIYRLSIAENGAQGLFSVGSDGEVSVEYWYADPLSGISLPHKKQCFAVGESWLKFCQDLRVSKLQEQIIGEMFDPALDNAEKTEAERTTKIRLGQDIYRKRLETLWGGACAVTGVTQRELLRASHAKPWAECTSGSERLSPYNGFLLNVALDALFDKHLLTFDVNGQIVISHALDVDELHKLGINKSLRLRHIDPKHQIFLEFHREAFHRINGAS